MRSLIVIITSVLNSDETIPELPPDQLIAFNNQGKPIPRLVDRASLLKIARLQTLIVKERERSNVPEINNLKQIADQSGQNFGTTLAKSLAIQEDTVAIIMMIERLIVEIVRSACPEVCERFGVGYVADISTRVYFSESSQRRFLD